MVKSVKNYFRLLAEGYENGALSKTLLPVLGVCSKAYGSAVSTVRLLHEKKILPRKKLPFPVVSVGNLTWGGTGKTPLVEFIARKAGERSKSALVLTRGYGNDEIQQMKHHLPRAIFGVGRNRYEVAQEIVKNQKVDMAILDDGLQHWAIERDIEIITVNSINPFGNEHLVPRGILREPLSILKRASIIVLTHTNLIQPAELEKLKQKIRAIAPEAFLADSWLEPLFFYRPRKKLRIGIDRLANQRVTTFSALAVPRSFQLILGRLQVKPVRNFEFPDHHVFTDKELDEIKNMSLSAASTEIVTTEKDYYRMPEKISDVLNPLVLATRLRIASGEDVLTDRLFRLLGVTR